MHVRPVKLTLLFFSVLALSCHAPETGQQQSSTSDMTTTTNTVARPHPVDSVLTYTTRDLQRVENRATLSLQYTWSAEQTGDPHKAFYFPRDMAIARNGDIYVLDTGNNQVQVFDSTRTYLRTLGKKGNGPGEFQMPQESLLLPGNRLLVSQPFQKRVQILSRAGQYLNGFPAEGNLEGIQVFRSDQLIVPDSRRAGNPNHHLFLILNFQGDSLGWLGIHKNYNAPPPYALPGILYTIDAKGQIYVGYGNPGRHIEKDIPSGTTLHTLYSISYQLSAHPVEYEGMLYDLTVSEGYLYALVGNRPKTQEERHLGSIMSRFGPGGPTNTHYYTNPDFKSETTDLYRLLIFDQWGRLVSSNQLPMYASKIRVYHRRLYIIDSFVGMKIYEYAIHLPAES